MATENRNTPNFDDICSKSTQIRSGLPAVYQLKILKQTFGTLTRVTVGEKDESKPNKTILLVGETGCEKSTLMNALVNYTMGVEFEDEIWFQIIEDECQISGVIVYKIFGLNCKTLPFSLTIIDTPCYIENRGIERDVKIKQQLLELFQLEDGVHEVHMVGLVMKATDNQVSDQMRCIFSSVTSLFGKNLETNIVALITDSNGKPPIKALQALESANIKCAKNERNQPVYFLFDNCQNEERTEDTEIYIENAWRVTQRGMKQFMAFVEKSSSQQPEAMLKVQIEQIRLTACLQNLKERIKFTDLKLRDIKQTQHALQNCKTGLNTCQKNTVYIPEAYKDIEQITQQMCDLGSDLAMCCLICKENCHYPGCMMALEPEQCEVMIDGKCTSCTNKCPTSDHLKKSWKYVIRTRKVKKKETAMKQKYKQSWSTGDGNFSLLQSLEKETEHLTEEKSQLVKDAYQHFIKRINIVDEDEDIDLVSNYLHLDFLIKKMKETDLEYIRELEEMYNQMNERTRTELQKRMKNVSANHEDLISESVRISSGPPAVYQLITKKQTFGTLTRVTVGEKDERKPNKTILLVGETGSGKSTLINALFNYTMGVRFENELWFQIVEEDKKRWGESQTSDVIVYEILGFEGKTLPFSLTIIDTPGFGDTKGIKHDVIVSQRLYDLFRSDGGVHEINAVGLVMKASVNRLSDRLMYIFDAVMSLFGKDLEENIIALITHSDGKPSENVSKALESGKIKYSKDETNQPVFFLFNNNTERGTKEREITGSKYYWDFTEEEMCRLRNFLEKSKPQALITTVEVLNKRIRLTACIQNLQERIKLTELNQTEIKQIQDALKTYEGEMKKNENFTVEVDKVYKEKEDIDAGKWWFVFLKGAVTCNSCMENCHYPGCTMARKPSHCKVMSWGRCTVCTNKCPASDHVKEKWRYVTKTKKEKITLEDVKQKYEHNKAACQDKLGLLENLEQEMTQLTVEKSQLIDEAYQHVVRLEQIALNVDSVFTYVHLDYLMEKMKEKGDTEKIQVLEIVKTRMDKCSKEESSQLNKVVGLVKQNMPKI